ncbi:MAG: NosD domain-containing protein, partial [Candidatus Bathyarchaeia archaeon]
MHVKGCNISGNNILGSEWGAGIWLYDSHQNIVAGNNIEKGYSGIRLEFSSNNFVFNNSVKGNHEGIALCNSDYNIVAANLMINNNVGVRISEAQRNDFYANNITSWEHGVRIGDDWGYVTHAEGNMFHENNFINNSKNVGSYVVLVGSNYFDNGVVGNYYSNFKGADNDGDGISETPYTMEEPYKGISVFDHYPLMSPFNTSSLIVKLPDWAFPTIVQLISPRNITYSSENVTLEFNVNKNPSWIGYSLDGQDTVTVASNTTLTNLSSGTHSIIIYANDTFGD